MGTSVPDSADPAMDLEVLTEAQVHYFETFGFLKVSGLFSESIAEITSAFEEVAADALEADEAVEPVATNPYESYERAFKDSRRLVSHDHVHFGRKRVIFPFIDKHHEHLRALVQNSRVGAVVHDLLGPHAEFVGSCGDVFDCDTSWHSDTYGASLDQPHIKLFLYLDPLDGDSGAMRVIPGSNHWQSTFAKTLRADLVDWRTIENNFGVPPDQIPSWTVSSEPGDLLIGNYRTVHATFHGADGRRLLTLSYSGASSQGVGS